ncbi:MAG: DUF3795 domain-containing protein [Candidatus Coatesbacteria bacterium]|nr:MAG: DUF3795 domain-containing protein [Candidatus Coatesbacteria bacterium]
MGAHDMDEMLGYCGYNCHLCAARSDDSEVRQKLVDGWRKFFGHENYTAENVRCDGCRADGRLADKECKVRPCALEKGVENCVYCDEFPCENLKPLTATREGMLIYCYPKTASITDEEYNLCMRQFESMPNLLRLLVESGKLPPGFGEAG